MVIKRWIKQHAKIGGSGEGRVFGDGVYSLLLIREAALVSGPEDTEICPDSTVDNENVDETTEIEPVSGNLPEVENKANLTIAVLEAKEDKQDFAQEETANVHQVEGINGQEPTQIFDEIPSQAQRWKTNTISERVTLEFTT